MGAVPSRHRFLKPHHDLALLVDSTLHVALRPHDSNFFVKKVFAYEQPHVFLWDNSHQIDSAFKPNYYRAIDIERKIKAYELMETQVRVFRSQETLRSMAQLRGAQSNLDYAEAFQILRYVEEK